MIIFLCFLVALCPSWCLESCWWRQEAYGQFLSSSVWSSHITRLNSLVRCMLFLRSMHLVCLIWYCLAVAVDWVSVCWGWLLGFNQKAPSRLCSRNYCFIHTKLYQKYISASWHLGNPSWKSGICRSYQDPLSCSILSATTLPYKV